MYCYEEKNSFQGSSIPEMDLDDDDDPVNVPRMSETSRRAKEKAEEPQVNGIKAEPEEAPKNGQKEENGETEKKTTNGLDGCGSENEDDNVS